MIQEEVQKVTARLGDLHVSPRKTHEVARLLKNLTVAEAQRRLNFSVKKVAKPLLKLLNSAVANATNNFQLPAESLFVKNVTVNQGRVSRRFMPRAQGRAFPIKRRTSIVEITLFSSAKAPSKKRVEPKALAKPDVKEKAELADMDKAPTDSKKFGKPKDEKFSYKPAALKRRLFNRKTNA